MLRKVLAVAVASAIGVLNINAVIADQSPVKSVEFIGLPHGQHPGENGSKDAQWATVSDLLDTKWGNRLKTAIGYIGTEEGALPAMK